MSRLVFAFAGDEEGATAIEYLLIVALVSLASFSAYSLLGGTVSTLLEGSAAQIAAIVEG